MELFGLLFAIPVTFVTSSVFCVLTHFAFRRWPRLRRIAIFASLMVVAYLALEAIAVFSIGPFYIYQSIGPLYWAPHLFGFFFGPPAIGVLVYAGVSQLVRFALVPIVLATVACWFMCMFTLLGNIGIDEDIHGIDDSGVRPNDGLFPP